jgi:hypothetical protein
MLPTDYAAAEVQAEKIGAIYSIAAPGGVTLIQCARWRSGATDSCWAGSSLSAAIHIIELEIFGKSVTRSRAR